MSCHRNETSGWHVCAGTVKHVVNLDLTVARTAHDGGAGRVADALGEPEVGEHAPKEITAGYKIEFLWRGVAVKTLRGQERPVGCGYTCHRFRRRGLA